MSKEIVPKSYKSNFYKYYVYQFILGIHTIRGVYFAYMTEWGRLNFIEIMALLNLLVGLIGSLNIFYVFIFVGIAIKLFTIFTRAKSEYL